MQRPHSSFPWSAIQIVHAVEQQIARAPHAGDAETSCVSAPHRLSIATQEARVPVLIS